MLNKDQAGHIAEFLLEYILKENIDPREAVINFEPIFNHVIDNPSYRNYRGHWWLLKDDPFRDYKITSEEKKIILEQSIYWLEHHSSSVNTLHKFRHGKTPPGMRINYRREFIDNLFNFAQDRPVLDSIKWKGK